MPVARATTSAISSAPTCVLSNFAVFDAFAIPVSPALASFSLFSNSGNLPY